MPYNVIALEALLNIDPDIKIDVISWGKDKKLTPYVPPANNRINYYCEGDFTYNDLIYFYQKHSYNLVYICNRREKKYLKLAIYAKQKDKILIIGQTDEQLEPNFRQLIKKIFSYILYRRYFDYMFATGLPQYEFLRFLRFRKNQILLGAYTANTDLFNVNYINFPYRRINDQKRVLFLGRLEKEKGLSILLESIKRFSPEKLKLVVVGNGKLKNEVLKSDIVEYHEFMDQESILKLLPTIDFFILPSVYEPWGVVIHEMASAGIPILCSDHVGSRWSFVYNNYNGFIFESGSITDLTKCLSKVVNISEGRLNEFKKRTFELSHSIKPALWAESIYSFIYDK